MDYSLQPIRQSLLARNYVELALLPRLTKNGNMNGMKIEEGLNLIEAVKIEWYVERVRKWRYNAYFGDSRMLFHEYGIFV